MAITVKGVDSTLQLTHWAQIEEAQSLVSPSPDGVLSGLAVSVSTGTRLLSVSAGSAVGPGVLATSSAAESVTLDANTSGSSRIDTIVLEVSWSGNSATAGDVKFVKGTPGATPVAPTLTRTAGVLWQIPLAYVTVANGAGQLAAANISSGQSGSGYQALSLATNYTQSNPTLAVALAGGVVEFSGAFRRTPGSSTVTTGTTVVLTTIPKGFRPRRDIGMTVLADFSGTPKVVGLYIQTDGTVSMRPITGSITAGDTIRPQTTWLPEV